MLQVCRRAQSTYKQDDMYVHCVHKCLVSVCSDGQKLSSLKYKHSLNGCLFSSSSSSFSQNTRSSVRPSARLPSKSNREKNSVSHTNVDIIIAEAKHNKRRTRRGIEWSHLHASSTVGVLAL